MIPAQLTSFRCYAGAGALEFLGLTDAELPPFDGMTENISGAGIAGEFASPTLGHFGSQEVTLKWRAIPLAAYALQSQLVQHVIDLRGSIQQTDPMLGIVGSVAVRVEVRGSTKSFKLGNLEPGKPMNGEVKIECAVIRISLDGLPVLELDKLNFRYLVNGVDQLRKTRLDMGGV